MENNLKHISHYTISIIRRFQTGIAREHSCRGDLQKLLHAILPDALVTNKLTRIACGAPDYILTRKNIQIGYVEVKDSGKPLAGRDHKEQFDRYRTSLDTLSITDYLDFPRIPDRQNADIFWQLVALGDQLRQLYLLESPAVDQFITACPQDGDNTITRRITHKDFERHTSVTIHCGDGNTDSTDQSSTVCRVWINDRQFFDNVPQIAWEFYIGGYQPAQKSRFKSGKRLCSKTE